MEIATTKKQRELMAHAIDLESRLKNKFKRKHKLKEDGFRNYYCASVGGEPAEEIARLCEMGFMKKGPTINGGKDFYAYVTPLGIQELMG